MPSEDMTGPRGAGPLTGRGLGPCGTGLGFRRGFRRYGMGFRRGFGFRIPFVERIALTKEQEKKVLQKELAEIETEKKEDYGTANLDLKKGKLEATGQAVFGEIPMPDIPDMPNLVVGMVLDKAGKIVEGAIIEIQDKEGNPSRVLKTNQLGQFKTLTQLADGKYLVVTDKDGLEFDRVEINLEGKIVKPIKIIAK